MLDPILFIIAKESVERDASADGNFISWAQCKTEPITEFLRAYLSRKHTVESTYSVVFFTSLVCQDIKCRLFQVFFLEMSVFE